MLIKRTYLTPWDIAVVTILLFGQAIYTSTVAYFAYVSFPEALDNGTGVEFTDFQNVVSIISEVILLSLSFAYLKWRNFDFSQFHIKFTPKAIVGAIGLFVAVAFIMDAYYYSTQYIEYFINYDNYQALANSEEYEYPNESFPSLSISIWLIIFALLNGFYEEIFFLGICLCVKQNQQKWAFVYSLIIRLSFHTYQGMIAAVGISLVLGGTFYVVLKKSNSKNLLPFFIAHSIADVVGLGILGYIIY
ncbi:MAG: CPBP family intramembrane metalloprotease [Gammaproteobacteria bacterium]|nr:CPBP family intramembrane metalloprotease [Gammaproteobacteria bacterium]